MRTTILLAIGITAGAIIQSGVQGRIEIRATNPPPPTATKDIASPQAAQEPWRDVEWFVPAMRTISIMETDGGRNQKPNVDGIVGIGQVERDFYQDAKEYAKTDDFPTYESLQGYDEQAFRNTCVVTWYWMQRYKASTPYLMFARYRKGPHGERTATGRTYADKAIAKYMKNK